MRVNRIGKVVDCIIQYDSMLTSVCKCNSRTLNRIILTCGGADHFNELYLREADTLDQSIECAMKNRKH